MKSAWVCMVVLFLSLPVLAKEVPGVTNTEVKLGGTAPLTGPIAFYGEMEKIARAYFDGINEAGGVNGRKIVFVFEDDAYSPPKAVEATRKLVEKDKVFGTFQSVGFPHTAVSEYLKQKKVPDFFAADGSKSYDKFSNVFRGICPWPQDGKAAAEYTVRHYAGKTVGVIFENSNQGREALEAAKPILAAGKVKLGPAESYDPGAPNADTQLLTLMNAKVDVVLALSVSTISASAAKLALQKGWKPGWVASFINASPDTIALGGAAVEGMVANVYLKLPDSDDPAMQAHRAFLAKAMPGTKASLLSVFAQANAEHMVETLKRAGKDLTRESALKAAESIKGWKCSLCLYPTEMDAKDHSPYDQLGHMQVKGGKWVMLPD